MATDQGTLTPHGGSKRNQQTRQQCHLARILQMKPCGPEPLGNTGRYGLFLNSTGSVELFYNRHVQDNLKNITVDIVISYN